MSKVKKRRLQRYLVDAQVTISLHQYVFASSKAKAIEKAAALALPSISTPGDWSFEPPDDPRDVGDEWRTSGELDGEPQNITAEIDDA